jgi:hypothetical protein
MISILTEAENLIHGLRATNYGDAGPLFRDANEIYRAIVPADAPIVEQGLYYMVALKFARHKVNLKRDNLVDAVGYIALLAEEQDL